MVSWMPVVFVVGIFLVASATTNAFLAVGNGPRKPMPMAFSPRRRGCNRGGVGALRATLENNERYTELHTEVLSIASELWGETEIPRLDGGDESSPTVPLVEGEAQLPEGLSFEERGDFFREKAMGGCPKYQHSYGLLLWSGFAGIERNAEESARFHAAAACQHHLDGMAVFGGCLRTGTGLRIKKKAKKKQPKGKGKTKEKKTNTVALGLELIEFCAEAGNPTGINKKAALLESNGNDFEAVNLYEASLKAGKANALLRFNLGWCLVNGQGVDRKDRENGIALWKEATEMAPDEGSEEAAWSLYQEFLRDDPKEAQRWLDLAEDLGFS